MSEMSQSIFQVQWRSSLGYIFCGDRCTGWQVRS